MSIHQANLQASGKTTLQCKIDVQKLLGFIAPMHVKGSLNMLIKPEQTTIEALAGHIYKHRVIDTAALFIDIDDIPDAGMILYVYDQKALEQTIKVLGAPELDVTMTIVQSPDTDSLVVAQCDFINESANGRIELGFRCTDLSLHWEPIKPATYSYMVTLNSTIADFSISHLLIHRILQLAGMQNIEENDFIYLSAKAGKLKAYNANFSMAVDSPDLQQEFAPQPFATSLLSHIDPLPNWRLHIGRDAAGNGRAIFYDESNTLTIVTVLPQQIEEADIAETGLVGEFDEFMQA